MATPVLNEAEIIERLSGLNDWKRDGNSISKTFQFKTYLAGLVFVSAVGVIAEGLDHHPDIPFGIN